MTEPRAIHQNLLIDADDTLWENNIYFEQAVDAFIDYLSHSTLTADQIRAVLDEIELANLSVNGYGSKGFAQNLRLCYEHLAERDVSDDDLATILGFGEQILLQEIVLLPDVPETLTGLAARHQLVMFTKGNEEEQRLKIDRSGLGGHFVEALVVAEKDEAAYREALKVLSWKPEQTWMIGNSPKSDINPALAVGLNAVFSPHDRTWRLEHQELRSGPGRFLQISRFGELLLHF